MSLTKKEQSNALKHLNSKWAGERKCSICQSNNWNVHPEIYEMRQFNGGNMVLGGPVVPLLMVECTNCGNTISMNAIRAGIVSPEAKEEKPNE